MTNWMVRAAVVIGIGATLMVSVAAQQAAPAFDVASVKLNQAMPPPRTGIQIGPDTFDAAWYPLNGLITPLRI